METQNLCDYSDAYILVTGNIANKPADQAAVGGDNPAPAIDSIVAFKNCAPSRTCSVNVNDEFIEETENIEIVSPMYNLLEYSDNYQDSTGSLYRFKRDEPPANNANFDNNTSSLEYKAKLLIQKYVPIITLSTKDNAKLSKLLNDGFKRSIYWNNYKTVHRTEAAADPTYRYQLDDSYQGVNRLFV